MAGIENVKRLLGFGLSIGNSIGKGLEDGKFDLADALAIAPDLLSLPDIIANGSETIDEVLDLTEEEGQELVEYAKAVFQLEDEQIEQRIESALALGMSVLVYLSTWIDG